MASPPIGGRLRDWSAELCVCAWRGGGYWNLLLLLFFLITVVLLWKSASCWDWNRTEKTRGECCWDACGIQFKCLVFYSVFFGCPLNSIWWGGGIFSRRVCYIDVVINRRINNNKKKVHACHIALKRVISILHVFFCFFFCQENVLYPSDKRTRYRVSSVIRIISHNRS